MIKDLIKQCKDLQRDTVYSLTKEDEEYEKNYEEVVNQEQKYGEPNT